MTRTAKIGFAVLLLISCQRALADQTIHVVLGPPETHEKPVMRHSVRITSRHLASRSESLDERVLGRLGMVVRSGMIRRSTSLSSQALAHVTPGVYLAITKDSGPFYGVLMVDSSIGWILKSAVNELDYRVIGKESYVEREPGLPAGYHPPLLTADQAKLLQYAFTYLGVPYQWGGNTFQGIDCSGFVKNVFADIGINLPRTAQEQMAYGMPVPADQLQPGDRLYFADREGHIVHTGIYIGNGYFIQASAALHRVGISRLSEPLYRQMFYGARR
ncbi:MAG: C40 family peptidase [Armatimonadetes bacterium]|nr:C40 family peptidase [Armatimonadota bacterium]